MVVTWLAHAPLAQAQAPAAPAAPEAVKVAMKIDLVAWGDTIEGLRINADGKDLKVTALAFEYSKAVAYAGSNILEIFRDAPTAAANPGAPPAAKLPAPPGAPPAAKPPDPQVAVPGPPGELAKRRLKTPDLVALALLPVGSTRVTVLIAPGANGTYQTQVIDDDPSKLPTGRLRIHNYSPIPIAIRCNRQDTVELKLHQSTVVAPVDQGVIYELAYQKDGKWEMQENNMIRVAAAEQVQLVVLQSDAGYFASSDGSRGGYLQTVVLRRNPKQASAVRSEPP
jgi:hypothetical protein